MNKQHLLIKGLLISSFLALGVGIHLSEALGATTKAGTDQKSAALTGDTTATAVTSAALSWPEQQFGKTWISRNMVSECCGNDATLALGELTYATGKRASISFHNAGVAEGTLELANGGTRRLRIFDNQGLGMGLEMSGSLLVNSGANEFRGGSYTYIDMSNNPGSDYNGRLMVTPSKFVVTADRDICIGNMNACGW
jgi:hypothetical protein